MKTIYQYCDEFKLNLVAKRHNTGEWNVRISHPWFRNPILSTSGNSFEQCMGILEGRSSVIENARTGIEKKNKLRNSHYERELANSHREDPEHDEWYERF